MRCGICRGTKGIDERPTYSGGTGVKFWALLHLRVSHGICEKLFGDGGRRHCIALLG